MRSVFLTSEWRKLAIVNNSIDPGILKPYLPFKTELDFWKGRCFVSLVGFRFIHTKLKGISIPFHKEFEEINLRFYVRHQDKTSWKRAVVFVKEIVPKPALTIIANSIYKEKYITLPTRYAWDVSSGDLKVTYAWKHEGRWDSMSVTALPVARDMLVESQEEFITEHYWGYSRVSDCRTAQYQVEHPRWQAYPVKSYQIDVRFADLYGKEFGILQDAVPDSVMLAEGSEIIVRAADQIE